MPVPSFTIDGVLPPYVGPDGPGGEPSDMTPYVVVPLDVVLSLGTTTRRRDILKNWLAHRCEMHKHGVVNGVQWLDGSFCEDKVPNDLDIVTLFYRPVAAQAAVDLSMLFYLNQNVFERDAVKAAYNLDAFFVDLNSTPLRMIDFSRYLLGLFSHRRGDDLWKGMLQVPLGKPDLDAEALAELDRLDAEDEAVAESAEPLEAAGGLSTDEAETVPA